MDKDRRKGTGTVGELSDSSLQKEKKAMSTSELNGEDIKELPDKEFF